MDAVTFTSIPVETAGVSTTKYIQLTSHHLSLARKVFIWMQPEVAKVFMKNMDT